MEIKYKAIELMERTMHNLQIIDQLHADRKRPGAPQPYEVTQLVNSFLGALAYPWEELRVRTSEDEPWNLTMQTLRTKYGFPDLSRARRSDTDPTNFRDLIRQLRNGMAHGNISFYSDHRREISGIEVWNVREGRRTWGTHMSTREMREFLEAFSKFARDPLVDVKSRHENS